MKPIKITYTCQSEDCEHKFEVNVSPIIPAKIYGPPETCYPAEGGEIEPENCPNCNKEVDCDLDTGVCDFKEKKIIKDGGNVVTEKVKGSTMNWGVLSDEKMRRNHYL